MPYRNKPLALAMMLPMSFAAHAGEEALLVEDVVVTGVRITEPLTVVTDPKAPRQPLPAHDGADYLKSIPGFSLIRKGGSDGDPVFRGMSGSRLNILLDGEQILGGCGNRMDPPTAYVFPETYDRITVLKGPQTVLYGPGNSAGTVLFERDGPHFDAPGWQGHASLMLGSFGRNDQMLQITGGTPDFYVEGSGSRSHANDYEDGDGVEVHSRYTRWNEGMRFGLTPDEHTRLELSAGRSDGEAAYADRSVDGAKFERDNLGLKFVKEEVSPWLQKIEVQAYYNYIDHVMDNTSLRDFVPTMMSPEPVAMNPDRTTRGGKFAFQFNLAASTRLDLGVDMQQNSHTNRMSMRQSSIPYQTLTRTDDARFRNIGAFGELAHDLGDRDRLIGGMRFDRWRAEDERGSIALTMMTRVANPTAGKTRATTLGSGFFRYEHDLAETPTTFYAGFGRSARFPDYWELFNKESERSVSAFGTDPETTTQLDIGAVLDADRYSFSASGFANRVDDYILIQSNVARGSGMTARTVSITRNIDAITWGGELSAAYRLTTEWKIDGSLAYVWGRNQTEDRPLAQMSPLEGRLGLNYDDRTWSFGALLRLVAPQHRVAQDQGNIVGQDIGKSSGFAVFSLNGGWRPKPGMLIAAGVDNLFDKTYAEHLSRGGAMLAGFTQTTRVNEPGRVVWLKGSLDF